MDGQINEMAYILVGGRIVFNHEKNEVLSFATTWRKPKDTVLSEVSLA